jgi:hypothetical protein
VSADVRTEPCGGRLRSESDPSGEERWVLAQGCRDHLLEGARKGIAAARAALAEGRARRRGAAA